MRKVLMGSIAVLVLMLALAGGAEAKCGTGCLTGKVRKLSASLAKAEKTIASLGRTVTAQGQTVAQQGQTIAQQGQTVAQQGQAIGRQSQAIKQAESVLSCLSVAPISSYGDPAGTFGYVFETEAATTVKTTALDVTAEGDFVEAWILFDACIELGVLSGPGGGAPGGTGGSSIFPGARPLMP